MERTRVLELVLTDPFPQRNARILTEGAASGFRYGGIVPLFDEAGGAIYTRNHGVFIDGGLTWLKACDKGSLFRCDTVHLSYSGRNRLAEAAVQSSESIEMAEQLGYNLVDVIPLTGFEEREAGPGTEGLFLVYEWRPEWGTGVSLDRWQLKYSRPAGEPVVCPVLGCENAFHNHDGKDGGAWRPQAECDGYNYCADHYIYVYPRMYAYDNFRHGLVFQKEEELQELMDVQKASGKQLIDAVKWEDSGEALLWNVVYNLEADGTLGQFINCSFKKSQDKPENSAVEACYYWGVDRGTGSMPSEVASICSNFRSQGLVCRVPPIAAAGRFGRGCCSLAIVLTEHDLELKNDGEAADSLAGFPDYVRDEPLFECDLEEAQQRMGRTLTEYSLWGQAIRRSCPTIGGVFFLLLSRKPVTSDWVDDVNQTLSDPNRMINITWEDARSSIGTLKHTARNRSLNEYLKGKTVGYSLEGELQMLCRQGS